MKKQELIHLHGLLAEVKNYYENETDSHIENDAYQSMGVKPTSIHKSKTDHKKAVFALTKGISEEIAFSESKSVSATAD
ncbi:MAG: UPF0058 family protein [Halobacteriaceae archaeon]